MKKSILVLAFSVVGISTFAASSILTNPSSIVIVAEEENKVEIEAAKLPAAVTESIKQTHKEATISKAYQILDKDKKVKGYEVVVKKGEKEETLKFDAAGKAVKEAVVKPADKPADKPAK